MILIFLATLIAFEDYGTSIFVEGIAILISYEDYVTSFVDYGTSTFFEGTMI